MNKETSSSQTNEAVKEKKIYIPPKMLSEKILEAGLGATCNGTTAGGRKSATPACKASSLKT